MRSSDFAVLCTRRRAAAAPALDGWGRSDQPPTVKRPQGDVEPTLGDAEPVGQLGGGNGPWMARPDGVEHRLLTLAESVVLSTDHARPSLAGIGYTPAGDPGRPRGEPTAVPFYRQLAIRS